MTWNNNCKPCDRCRMQTMRPVRTDSKIYKFCPAQHDSYVRTTPLEEIVATGISNNFSRLQKKISTVPQTVLGSLGFLDPILLTLHGFMPISFITAKYRQHSADKSPFSKPLNMLPVPLAHLINML